MADWLETRYPNVEVHRAEPRVRSWRLRGSVDKRSSTPRELKIQRGGVQLASAGSVRRWWTVEDLRADALERREGEGGEGLGLNADLDLTRAAPRATGYGFSEPALPARIVPMEDKLFRTTAAELKEIREQLAELNGRVASLATPPPPPPPTSDPKRDHEAIMRAIDRVAARLPSKETDKLKDQGQVLAARECALLADHLGIARTSDLLGVAPRTLALAVEECRAVAGVDQGALHHLAVALEARLLEYDLDDWDMITDRVDRLLSLRRSEERDARAWGDRAS